LAKGVFGKAPLRVLPRLMPSNVHTVQFPANEPRQAIAYSSFHSKPLSIPPATLSYHAEFADIALEYSIGWDATLFPSLTSPLFLVTAV
jgi:hypothetical protein